MFSLERIRTPACCRRPEVGYNSTVMDSVPDPDPDPDPGSGSEILDFQFENPDPDPKLLMLDPEH